MCNLVMNRASAAASYVHCDIEREIDGMWFPATLLRHDAEGVTIQASVDACVMTAL